MNALHRIAALFHRNKSVSAKSNSKRQLRLESLEERQLLSVTPLGWFPEMEYVTEISPSRPSNDDSGDDPFSYLPGSDEWNRLASQGTVLDDEVIREAFRGLEPESPNLMNTTSGCGGGGPERGSAYHTGCGSTVWSACSGAPVPSYSLSVLQSPIREGETGNSAYPLDALIHLTSSWPYADTNYIKIVNGGFIDTTGCDYGFSAVDITKFGGVTPWRQGVAASFTGGEITLTFRAEDDAIPHYDNDVEIDFYVGCYPSNNSGCGWFYSCGWQSQVHGAKSGTVTVKDNDNWEISVSVIDDEALEPCTWIPGNQRTGAFEITKQPGDEFCVDESYDIFVEFTLGGTALPFSMGPNPRDYHITTNPNGGDPNAMAVYVGSKNVWRTKIPAGQDSLKLYVMPDGDHIFENDETVTLMITEAYAVEGHSFNVSGANGAVTILQAPEFISDADKAVNVTIDNYTVPLAINGDNYYSYVSRNAEAGKKVNTVTEIFAANNHGVAYSIVSGNEAGLFQIDENTGVITTAVSLKDSANLAASYALTIKAYDPQHSLLYDLATVPITLTQWIVNRDNQAKAPAASMTGCTLSELADEIGLMPGEFKKWLTFTTANVTLIDGTVKPADEMGVDDILAGNQQFEIPNTMYMAWFGEMGSLGLGQFWMRWEQNVNNLQELGFYVETFNNDTFGKNEAELARTTFEAGLAANSLSKELHGLYMMGHGYNNSVGSKGTNFHTSGPIWNIPYRTPNGQNDDGTPFVYQMGDNSDSIGGQIKYHFGALIIHACHSNNENALSLVSGNNSIFVGQTGTYYPIVGVERIACHWGAKHIGILPSAPDNGSVFHIYDFGGKQKTKIYTTCVQI